MRYENIDVESKKIIIRLESKILIQIVESL